ncbi:class I SAM-dependent methyltransferase family protein [Halorussus limi]|uniref:tRNA(Phe) (4-demethylwyosine(37)-C(7)) aminocarboxypropyltransferase n=1 Tax=Halorussus limi TaxID=2938695 RepID=A0A8U0HWQ1_9EURY|nr:class I SAM-dependent methyltransferase family protein [Halorussus limi]UPV75545.1 class I SAM-dependent methyltransferase family protein [Halorussus limi]
MTERDGLGDESDADDAERHLAAVVRKPESEATIAALRGEGVYDATRKVREHDEALVELPVTDPPSETDVLDVVEQVAPDRRLPDLESRLRERGWTEAEIERAPGSWAVVGSVVLVTFEDCPRREEVGEALLALHGEADTVLANEGVSGVHREPSVSVVAGAGDTETVHTEHGTRYALDLAEVMFSPGNKAERARMGEVVEPGERVFDMFAGIGYFTLPMARAGADVTAAERNPAAFRFLIENAMLNDVSERVSAFRADCRDVVEQFSTGSETESNDAETDPRADRVVMGYYDASEPRSADAPDSSDASYEYLDSALAALKPGGVVHMHEATPEELLWDRPVSRLREAAANAGRDVEVLDRRKVKSHSEGVWHVVVDAEVT